MFLPLREIESDTIRSALVPDMARTRNANVSRPAAPDAGGRAQGDGEGWGRDRAAPAGEGEGNPASATVVTQDESVQERSEDEAGYESAGSRVEEVENAPAPTVQRVPTPPPPAARLTRSPVDHSRPASEVAARMGNQVLPRIRFSMEREAQQSRALLAIMLRRLDIHALSVKPAQLMTSIESLIIDDGIDNGCGDVQTP